MEDEKGFKIDGRRYPVPSLDDFNLDEGHILQTYSGLSVEDFIGDDERILEHFKSVGLMKAWRLVAYMRGNPDVSKKKAESVIAAEKWLEVYEDFHLALIAEHGESEAEDDADPPALTSEPAESSPRSSLSNGTQTEKTSDSSGSDSTLDSGEPVVDLSPTGLSRSDTSPISVQML